MTRTEMMAETEWNLGFAYAEVVARLEKMLKRRQLAYCRQTSDTEARFEVTLPPGRGRAELIARPLVASGRPAPLQAVRSRTLLRVRFEALDRQQRHAFMQDLSLAFLRVGG